MATKSRRRKIETLAKHPGTPGEKAAAEAALERLSASLANPPATGPINLTDAVVKRLPPPATGHIIVWDATVAGFGCRVTAAGAKSYVMNYRVRGSGQQRRVTIGAASSWSASSARDKAKELRRIVDDGGDPRGDEEEAREAATMADLMRRFDTEYLPRRRASTARAYRGMIKKHIGPFFGKFQKVADVEYADIDRLHRRVTATGSTYVANRCAALCSRMFSLAIKWGIRTDNPAKGIERNAETKRKRYMSADERRRLMLALAEHPDRQFVAVVLLLMLTGARKGEVLGMKWADVTLAKDKGVWLIPGSSTKQRVDHSAPISGAAVAILKSIERRSEFVFPSDGKTGHLVDIKKGWAALCKTAAITGLRMHDLRHSFASQLASSGASLPLIGALLGHSSPTTTHRYAHLFDDPQRAAVEKIGTIISGDREK
ncbi:MAG: integrase [Bradyrhizobium sp.]|nr:integrase [Bradyrhizobium sp.]